jgi:hypothetical protein
MSEPQHVPPAVTIRSVRRLDGSQLSWGGMDACNRRLGHGTLARGRQCRAPAQSTEFLMRTPLYTTPLDELPHVRGAVML